MGWDWRKRSVLVLAGLLLWGLVMSGCGADVRDAVEGGVDKPHVVVDTTFLADIVRNVAGDLFEVKSLLPEGVDPHAFEPSPRDAAAVAEADVVVVTYRGLEPGLVELLQAAVRRGTPLVDVSAGVPGVERDPHLWLDPVSVIDYVRNLENGLAAVLPQAKAELKANAQAYIRQLEGLDVWIKGEVARIPENRRLLVTNHESFGWFARRYGFTVVGTLLPGQSTEGVPSAERLASLVAAVETSGAPAVFLETGGQEDLAQQIARETGTVVVTGLHTHSLSEETPSYLEMMRWNVRRIVEAVE